MKILKRGKLPDDRVLRGKCSYCKTEIEFMQKEGNVIHSQKDGDCVTIDCPVCSMRIVVSL